MLIGNFGALGFGRSPVFPTLFGAADFIPDFVIAVSMGFLMRRKWLPVVALNAGLLALFFVNPLTSILVTIPGTSISIPFAWMHIAAFIVLLSPLALKAAKWVQTGITIKLSSPSNEDNQKKSLAQSIKNKFEKVFGNGKVAGGLVILVFIGTMMQHLAGNILFEVAYGQISPPIIPAVAWPAEWTAVVFAYPIERTILIISAVLVGTPLIVAITRNRLLEIGKPEKPKPAISQPEQPKATS